MPSHVTFDRPVKAKLLVRLDNGEEFEPRPEDLDKFGLGYKITLYERAKNMLLEALELGTTDDADEDTAAQSVRYMIECALMFDHSPWANEKGEPWPGEDSGLEVKERIRRALLTRFEDLDGMFEPALKPARERRNFE
jgi:hypothetical protein